MKNKTVLIIVLVMAFYFAYKCGLVSKLVGSKKEKESVSDKKKSPKKAKKKSKDDDEDDDDDDELVEKANKADLVARKVDDIHRKQIDPPKPKSQ